MRRRSLRFEPLERRLLLAGDVNVTLSRGTLNVTGDGADNEIAIEYLAPNTFGVTGGGDTTLRGGDEPIELSGVNSIRVNMREGNNRVEIRGTVEQPFMVSRDLRIQSGRGDDVVVVERADIGGQLNISTPGGNNHAAVLRTNIRGNLSVSTGNGAEDRIAIAGVTARNVTLNGGNSGRRAALGDSEIGLTGSTITGGLTIRTGVGDDLVGVGDNDGLIAQIEGIVVATLPDGGEFSLGDAAGPVDVTGNVSITTNSGNDQVLVEALNAAPVRRGGFTINTSHGDNNVAVLDSQIGRNISITTGNGNDQVALVSVQEARNITVRTGNGAHDRIGLAGVDAARVTLDSGNSGRRASLGAGEIGVTGSAFTGNLTIRTGVGSDQVGVGDNQELIQQIQQTVAASLPAGATFSLAEVAGRVAVTGSVSITTNNGNDEVLVEALDAPPIRRGGLTINAGNGDNRVGLVNSTIERNVSITTGSGSDRVGLVDVLGAANVTVRAGHGAVDQIGVAGVQATNITLDGGNSGRRVAQGRSEIGITDSIISNNLTIRTGIGDDMVAVGDHPALNEMIEPWKDPATLEEPDSDVNVASSVSISTNSGDDGVWIRGLTGSASVTINTSNGDDEIGVVDSAITGNIRIDTGNSTGIRHGDEGDQVGLIRVTVGNLTVNNSLGNAGFGLAEVTAANVILNGGNSVNSRTANFGSSWIGVTSSEMANLTIRQGHIPDGVIIGVHQDLDDYFQIPDPSSDDPIDYEMGTVKVDGMARVDTNAPGRVSYGDVVRISDLRASVLRVNTGLGNDTLTIGENMDVTNELTIKMGGGEDALELGVADPDAFVADLPAGAVIDGGSGTDTLNKYGDLEPLDAVFRSWENVLSL